MQMVPVKSTSIAAIGYDAHRRWLEIEFRKSGKVYRYFEVPAEEHAAFMEAESKGNYLNRKFRSAGYLYEPVK
jgi:hypothetical protein